ncbi:hypothetical protein HELRODRAFT_175952 [Helobdella robusta]|uniref:Uncharacterized protein n=1 Tax=Helobdella robusta TaxID=6412 RepID=T1F9Y4_HELRO|nr:hypothetical protein HELRODRAFT_175952 [Helobdella robusta]ESO00510.1 hypothetical protein HELRODRAFT_175952 [Helobdella robusta]
MRKERMKNLSTTGIIAGKRDRGQQEITFVKSLCHLLNITTFQLLQNVKYRGNCYAIVSGFLTELVSQLKLHFGNLEPICYCRFHEKKHHLVYIMIPCLNLKTWIAYLL